jgi:poly-gamma-glutamate synthesis protein (capsule biosynthesis protein)
MVFNFNPRVLSDLVQSGFDVISTANNHAMDRGPLGVDRTVEGAERAGLPQTGMRRRDDTRSPWHTITREGGFTLAWIACTYGTNGMPDPNRQVLNCYSQTGVMEREINELANDSRIDAVIVTPHWGTEGSSSPGSREKALARRFFQAGALAVIGAHPHVLQTWEKVVVGGRERFVAYSTGNFLSNQLYYGTPQRTGTILYLGLTRTRDGTVINGVKHTPTYMKRDPFRVYAYDRISASERSSVLSHVRGLMSSENELGSGDRLVTNPECR